MTPAPTSTQLRRRETEVLEAAASVFAEHGYHGATTQLIADRLGIRQASLYYYVRSKEQALEQVCLHGVAAFIARAETISRSDMPAPDKILALARAHLRPLEDERDFVTVFVNERRYLDSGRRRAVAVQARRLETIWETALSEGAAAGAFAPELDIRLTTLGLLGMLNSVCAWQGREAVGDVSRVADRLARMALDGLRAKPVPKRKAGSRPARTSSTSHESSPPDAGIGDGAAKTLGKP